MTLIDTLTQRAAEHPRLIVPDVRVWRQTREARGYKRVTVGNGGCTILDRNPPVKVRQSPEVAERDLGSEWLNWLLREHGVKRLPYRRDQLAHLQTAQPLYAAPGQYRDMAYVDLSHAYHELYSVAAMCGTYIPDPDCPVLSLRKDLTFEGAAEMAPLRTARNMVIGIMRSTKRTFLQPDGRLVPVDATGQNVLLSPGLWGYMGDTLHAVACDALSFGAVYVNTDGYIVPADRAVALMEHLASRWALGSEVKHVGDADICAPGSWQVGTAQSLTWPAPRHPMDQIRRIDPRLTTFLARRRGFLVSRA